MHTILPAILAHSEQEFLDKLALFDGIAPVIHVDVMDGNFVPNTTWFDVIALNAKRFQSRFELHLMVNDPLDVVLQCEEMDSVARILWHAEAPVDHLDILRAVRHSGRQAGIAINPATSLASIDPLIDLVDEVLIMGNEPGFSGKTLDTRMIDRAQEIHTHHPEAILGFDIGVNAQTIPQLVKAGVTRLCTASALFQEKNPVAMYRALEEKMK